MYSTTTLRKISIVLPILVCACLYFFVMTHDAFAQTTPVSIEVSPRYPTPGETVRAKFYAPSLDRDTSLIAWNLNGEVLQQEYSGTELTFTAGEVGQVLVLSVTAEDAKGKRVSGEVTLYVSDIVLVWEGKTYAPPFYQGRPMHSPGASVSFVALPTVVDSKGNVYKNDDLIYLWYTTKSSVPTISGKGKHSVVLQNDQPFTTFSVRLEIKDPQGTMRIQKHYAIPTEQPKVLLYEDVPLVGVRYDRAIGKTFGIFDRETTVVAEPYHISATSRTDTILNYAWTIAGETYTKPGSIALGSDGVGYGSTYVSLVIKNTKFWAQSARADVQVDFGKNEAWGSDVNPETQAL